MLQLYLRALIFFKKACIANTVFLSHLFSHLLVIPAMRTIDVIANNFLWQLQVGRLTI